MKVYFFSLPPAARGDSFCKNRPPWTPSQKLLIKGGHSLHPGRIFMQPMNAFGSFKVRRLKRRPKASIPLLYANSNSLYDILHFAAFSAGSIQLKKPSVGPKGLIGPPCQGVEITGFLWYDSLLKGSTPMMNILKFRS